MRDDSEGHRKELLEGLRAFVAAARRIAGVRRIAVLGSIMTTKPDRKDIDVLVVVADDADLKPLATSARRLQGHAQSINKGADVFLADERGTYIGRTCRWKDCRPGVLTGCLRNARAVAKAAQVLGATFNVCPAGERWSDGAVRFAVEDWLAAGAILRHVPGRRSSEAEAEIAAFERSQGAVLEALMASSSGRELIELSFQIDVECAAQVDASERIPRLVGNAFVDISGLAV